MQSFASRKVLVVGGAGFVGSNLVRALLEQGPERVLVVDNLLSSERTSVPDVPNLDFEEASITDDGLLRRLPADLDYVFHLATYHGNQSSIHDPLADHANNTLTTLKLYEALKSRTRLRKVVYSSAGCTVAPKTFTNATATDEESPVSLHLDSPYQISKIVGELYSNYYHARHGLPVVKARFQNVYGPGEVLGAGAWRGTPATVWRNVVPTFIYRGLKGLPLQVENGGVPTRDFIYVDDIVNGLLTCALDGRPGEVYNLASGVETSIQSLAERVVKATGGRSAIERSSPRAWDHSGKRFGSTDKARRELGFAVRWALDAGVEETVRWAQAHLGLIEACIARHDERMAAHRNAA